MNLIILSSLHKKTKANNMCFQLNYLVKTKYNSRIIFFAILLLLTMQSKAQKHDAFIANGKSVDIRSFNKDVEAMMEEVGVPGMSLAVIDNNKVVFFNAYGYRQKGGEKVDTATVFEGCSLSKSFLVFVVYQLVDQGKLDLDKPMYQYLENQSLSHDPRYKKITARMILSHSSGIENWKYRNNPNLLEIVSNPGEEYVYSGEGYNYLARVVELILKKPYEEYIKEMVIKPVGLKNTFTSFNQETKLPSDYAVGYDRFGKEIKKYLNLVPNPASQNHFTAEDYANLIISIFNGKYVSEKSVKQILTPIVRLEKVDTAVYYGPGFEVWHDADDMIIYHGGSNFGFKNIIFYSVAKKSGLIFMTNSDRGTSMAAKLCSETVGLNLAPKFKYDYYEQYPSAATKLWKIFNDRGAEDMFLKIRELKNAGSLGDNTLNELADLLMANGDPGDLLTPENADISKRLLEYNLEMHPRSPLVYALLAKLHLQKSEYDEAFKYFEKAMELHFDLWPIEKDMKECKDLQRCAYRKLNDTALIIQAEDYCAMNGVILDKTSDQGGGNDLDSIDSGDWMEYTIDVPKNEIYVFTCRVASESGGGQFQILSGSTISRKIDVGSTKGYQNWSTVTTTMHLSPGKQKLKLYVLAGGFNINWLQIDTIRE